MISLLGDVYQSLTMCSFLFKKRKMNCHPKLTHFLPTNFLFSLRILHFFCFDTSPSSGYITEHWDHELPKNISKTEKKIMHFLWKILSGGDIHPLWQIKRMRGGGGYHPLTHTWGVDIPPGRDFPPPQITYSYCGLYLGFKKPHSSIIKFTFMSMSSPSTNLIC